MEKYKYHIKALQDRIKKKDFEGLIFMSDEELGLTDAPPIIPRRDVGIVELTQIYPQIEMHYEQQIQSERELSSQKLSDEKR